MDKLQNGGRHIPFGRKRQGCKQIETDECPKVWWTSYQNKKKLFSYRLNYSIQITFITLQRVILGT